MFMQKYKKREREKVLFKKKKKIHKMVIEKFYVCANDNSQKTK